MEKGKDVETPWVTSYSNGLALGSNKTIPPKAIFKLKSIYLFSIIISPAFPLLEKSETTLKKTVANPAVATTNKETTTSKPFHPPFLEMIFAAISTLKDRTGSSQPAIAKFIEDKYSKMPPSNFKKLLSVQLKKFVKFEKLVKLKNSYKISSTESLKLVIKETQKKKGSAMNNSSKPKEKAEKKVSEKRVKIKRLSQVKTPEALKKAKKDVKKLVSGSKVKHLSQVKTPEGLKRKTSK